MSWLGSAVCLAVSGHYLSHLTGMRKSHSDPPQCKTLTTHLVGSRLSHRTVTYSTSRIWISVVMRSIHSDVSYPWSQISGSHLLILELECLRHLRELKADGNKINSLVGLERMDSLVKLSVERNEIRVLDLGQFPW